MPKLQYDKLITQSSCVLACMTIADQHDVVIYVKSMLLSCRCQHMFRWTANLLKLHLSNYSGPFMRPQKQHCFKWCACTLIVGLEAYWKAPESSQHGLCALRMGFAPKNLCADTAESMFHIRCAPLTRSLSVFLDWDTQSPTIYPSQESEICVHSESWSRKQHTWVHAEGHKWLFFQVLAQKTRHNGFAGMLIFVSFMCTQKCISSTFLFYHCAGNKRDISCR